MKQALLLGAIPLFIVSMLVEHALVRRRRGLRGYERKDTLASLAMGVGYLLVSFALRGLSYPIAVAIYEVRLFDLPTDAAWTWPLLVFAEDFCFYWYHRTGHQVRFFWAAHVNHHSSERYNLSTALRQVWLAPILGPVFWFPLPLIGFDPAHVLVAQAISLVYQFFLHTELVDKLPRPIEWIFNTPSHHRVHHGSNSRYLDRNHGGIFIIWDRLLGTFEPEVEPPRFGLTKNIETFNPVRIAFHELVQMTRDVLGAPTLRAKLGHLFGPPGWRPDGAQETSSALRQSSE